MSLPQGFVYLTDKLPSVIESNRYFTDENFLGRGVPGYQNNHIVCLEQVAQKLIGVTSDLKDLGHKLVVYDAYRPQSAVNAFFEWCKDSSDEKAKTEYYPTIEKNTLFDRGYIALQSTHSRGCAIDISIIPMDTPLKSIVKTTRNLSNGDTIIFLDDNTVDMGGSFDLFHEISHHDTSLITDEQKKMREMLRLVMKQNGFCEYANEWWHYNLSKEEEPFPDTYFNFIVPSKN